jgi:acetylornithine deacetylase/succinyl-diaminopimelate desuccinylase-like protein
VTGSPTAAPSDIERRVLDHIDAHAEDAVEFFRRLVRIQSSDPPGDVREIADVCAEFGRQLGMEVAQYEPAPGRVSNVLRLRGAGGGPTFLLNSHLDTFPASDLAAWRYPPFGAEVHDGRVWGVGTRDMKAGLTAALLATQAVVSTGARLRGDVVLTQTADHIKGGGVLGLKYLVDERLVNADFGIYTESNPPLAIELASRGMLRFEITLTGFAKHTKYKVEHSASGQPINAILKAARLTIALEAMAFTNWSPHDYIVGPPVISVNRIAGGFSDTLIADRCTLVADCRYLPGQDPDSVIADVRAVIDTLAAEDPEFRATLRVLLHGEASQVAANTPLVETLQGAIETVIGRRVPLGGAGSTSDMRFLVNDAGIPMVKFMFPSSETGTNEFETIEDFLNTWRVYSLMLVRVLS